MVNRFVPSMDLAERIFPDRDLMAGIVESGHSEADSQDFISKKIIRIASALAFVAGANNIPSLRIGEEGHFSDDFLIGLYTRVPYIGGDSDQLYSKLYGEFYHYLKQNGNHEYRFGTLTTDEKGIVVEIKPTSENI